MASGSKPTLSWSTNFSKMWCVCVCVCIAKLIMEISWQLVIKIKMKRIVYSSTLAEHSIALDSLGLLNQQGEESMADRCV